MKFDDIQLGGEYAVRGPNGIRRGVRVVRKFPGGLLKVRLLGSASGVDYPYRAPEIIEPWTEKVKRKAEREEQKRQDDLIARDGLLIDLSELGVECDPLGMDVVLRRGGLRKVAELLAKMGGPEVRTAPTGRFS